MFIEKCYFYHLSCSLNRMILQRYTLFIYYTSFPSIILVFLTDNVCAGMTIQYATLSMAIIVSCLNTFRVQRYEIRKLQAFCTKNNERRTEMSGDNVCAVRLPTYKNLGGRLREQPPLS